MNNSNLIHILIAMFFVACTSQKKESEETTSSDRSAVQSPFKYIFDMVHNNPGEGSTETVYNDPAYVKERGYNGMVVQWHVQCGVTYDSFEKGIIPEGSEDREWILKKQQFIKTKLAEAKAVDMPVYAFTDMFVIPSLIDKKYRGEIVKEGSEGVSHIAIEGKMKPDINREMTQKLLKIQLDELFGAFPELDGLVIRTGETYLYDTPFHTGGIAVARRGEEGIADQVKMINLLREEVCVKRGKKLFYRTWEYGDELEFFHTDPQAYLAITDQIEPHENLVFSIKHSRGDFWRMKDFNPTLGIGKHQQIIEMQCQREYEGKGAHPNYVAKGVIEGFEEHEYLMNPGQPNSLAEMLDKPQIVGLWTWSRGGGWKGPYIKNELWSHLNTYVATNWAKNPSKTELEIFDQFMDEFGITENNSRNYFREMCRLTAPAILRGRDTRYADVYVMWTRDQYFYGQEKLQPTIDELLQKNLVDKALEEKEEAVTIWKKIENISKHVKMADAVNEEYVRVSATYGRIKYEIAANAWKVLLLGAEGEKSGDFDKNSIQEAIVKYDALWVEWKKLKQENEQCATIYEPNAFSIDMEGVKGDVTNGIGAAIDKYRSI